MSYTIKNSAQTVTYTVNDGTANTNAISLTLIGKSLANYGTALNENFVYLLENFSNTSSNPPAYPVQGQLWWDSTYKFLNVYDNSAWKTVYGNLETLNVNSAVTLASSLTASALTASALTASGGGQLIGYHTGAIGANTANTGAFTTVTATSTIVSQGTITGAGQIIGYHNGAIGANAANSGTFTTVISSGNITAQTANVYAAYVVANSGLSGTLITNAQTNITSTGSLTSPSFTTSGGGQHIGYLTGAIGANTANTGSFTTVVASGNITAQSANMYAANHVANTATYSAAYYWANGTVFGTTSSYGNTQVAAYLPTYTGNLGIGNIFLTNGNLTANIGNINTMFSYSFANNFYGTSFYGTSTTAKYADLAEKYLTDTEYPVGTVVMVGGDAEVTQHDGRAVRAIGTVSQNPAFKMNDDLDGGTYIALKGRVPVRVSGPVLKGQSLRGSPWGVAIAEEQSSPYTFAIAMETIADQIQTIIEAVIL